jgi:ABC-type branched-subunit amino acid transport system ATPase component/branched-subunit amino acid ABC-type transport system permease component
MREIIQFAVLGLGAGSVYGLTALGLTLVRRGSGLVNLAMGAFVMMGGAFYHDFSTRQHLNVWIAALLATLATSALSAASYWLAMRPLQRAAPLAQLIATLGLLLVLIAVANMRYGFETLRAGKILPAGAHELLGIKMQTNRLLVFAIGLVLTTVLWAVYKWTHFGRVTAAAAENPMASSALGHNPLMTATANWAVGGALAGFSGCLLTHLGPVQVVATSLVVVPALAAALAGNFKSFPIVFGVGILIGILESEMARYVTEPGWSRAVPFLVIAVVLTIRGDRLPSRGHIFDRLPEVATGVLRLRVLVPIVVVALIGANLLSLKWQSAILLAFSVAVIALSVVVLTGFAGQLSLAPYAFAGISSLIAARVALGWHWSLVPAGLLGAAGVVLVGLLVALPALRTRGINLAVITLGFSVSVDAVVFENQKYTGGINGTNVGAKTITLFGWPVDFFTRPERYLTMAILVFALLAFAIRNVRQGVTGRRLLTVRANERAAASLGVSVTGVKLYAFGLSAFIAGIGGVLFSFKTQNVSYTPFSTFNSLILVGLVVLGGVGYTSGALVAGALVAGSIVEVLINQWIDFGRWLPLISGLTVIHVVQVHPNGLAATIARLKGHLSRRRARRQAVESPSPDESAIERVQPKVLTLEAVSVSFAGVVAVDHVDLSVAPGEVVGLIGPNGAGKTTIIDGVTGYVRTTGKITLDEERIDQWSVRHRSRQGVVRSFQSVELFEDMTVLENIAVACEVGQRSTYLSDMIRPRPPALSAAARAALIQFGLTSVVGKRPGELSFGQRRLAGIARAVASAPSVVLLDEPAAGLSKAEAEELGGLIRQLASQWGMGVLLVEHNLDIVTAFCDRLVVIEAGQIIASGSPSEVIADPRVVRAYTGRETRDGRTVSAFEIPAEAEVR